jgi:antitoxin (DNA-binding transcriptional repressor) of toxin-antitoxin stability system
MVLLLRGMSTVTAKQLHQKTKDVLNQLERGEPFLVTRNGRTIGRLSPITAPKPASWDEIMKDVWKAQENVKPSEKVSNPVLRERQRRRR